MSDLVEKEFKDEIDRYDMIVIIPGSGCAGCISNAERFFQNNVTNEKTKFILTHNASVKNLTLRVGKENIALPNVLIDKEDLFYLSKHAERIYPYAFYVNNGKIRRMYGHGG